MPNSTSHCAARVGLLLSILVGGGLAGCETAGRVVDPLNVLGLNKRPVRIGVTQIEVMPPPLLLPKRSLFERDLAGYLNEPVSFDLLNTRQIRVHLGTGRLSFAMLSTPEYCDVLPAGAARILAVPINANGETSRKGLVVVGSKSRINSLAELRGKRFHFMPQGDVLNEAASGALLEAGLSQRDVDPGLLGLGLDTHHISSVEVAKSVVLEDAVGVIDAADYKRWKPTGGSVLLMTPSQDEVRVLAETVRVPEGPVVVSGETPKELADKLSEYLTRVLTDRKVVLATLGCRGFAGPIDAKEYEAFCGVHRKLHPELTTQCAAEPGAGCATEPAEDLPLP
jgi:hypothetical protein